MSVVVPPTSTTMASSSPDRNAAPRMLFVGLEENEYTGKRFGMGGEHDGAVVLRQIQRRVDARGGHRIRERPGRAPGQ